MRKMSMNQRVTQVFDHAVFGRDGHPPEWPYFILCGDDPLALPTLRYYAGRCAFERREVVEGIMDAVAYYQRVHKPNKSAGAQDDHLLFKALVESRGDEEPCVSPREVVDVVTQSLFIVEQFLEQADDVLCSNGLKSGKKRAADAVDRALWILRAKQHEREREGNGGNKHIS
jgi:hypothetical protein